MSKRNVRAHRVNSRSHDKHNNSSEDSESDDNSSSVNTKSYESESKQNYKKNSNKITAKTGKNSKTCDNNSKSISKHKTKKYETSEDSENNSNHKSKTKKSKTKKTKTKKYETSEDSEINSKHKNKKSKPSEDNSKHTNKKYETSEDSKDKSKKSKISEDSEINSKHKTSVVNTEHNTKKSKTSEDNIIDTISESNVRKVSESVKKRIAGKQYFKCANKPNSNLVRLDNFSCPLWKISGDEKGCFNESGYEIDHINEFSITKDDSENNLQALCLSCHSVKTKRFMSKKKGQLRNAVIDIDDSEEIIDIDKQKPKMDFTHIKEELEYIYDGHLNEKRVANLIYKLYGDKYLYDRDGEIWYEIREAEYDGHVNKQYIDELIRLRYDGKYWYDRNEEMWYEIGDHGGKIWYDIGSDINFKKYDKHNKYIETDKKLISLRDIIENNILDTINSYIYFKKDELLKKAKTKTEVTKIKKITTKKLHSVEKFLIAEAKKTKIIKSMESLCSNENSRKIIEKIRSEGKDRWQEIERDIFKKLGNPTRMTYY